MKTARKASLARPAASRHAGLRALSVINIGIAGRERARLAEGLAFLLADTYVL